MDTNYYRDYYRFEREHWWFKARREILRQYIARHIYAGSPLNILNIGAATGASSEMLGAFGPVTSTEYDQGCIDFVKDKLPFPILRGDIRSLQFPDAAFDLVCAFDVIEHVEDDAQAVREMQRVCRQGGGHLLVTVPALMSLWSEHDEINHHFRRYETPEIEALFAQNTTADKQFVSYYNARLFPMIYAARKLSNLLASKTKEKELQSDFEKFKSGFLSDALYRIMAGESGRLLRQKPYRLGVSILAHYQK